MAHDFQSDIQIPGTPAFRCPFQHQAPFFTVGLHNREFFICQPSGLQQNRVGNHDLADIVQRAGGSDQFHIVVCQTILRQLFLHHLGQHPGKCLDALDMHAAFLVAQLHHVAQHLNDLVVCAGQLTVAFTQLGGHADNCSFRGFAFLDCPFKFRFLVCIIRLPVHPGILRFTRPFVSRSVRYIRKFSFPLSALLPVWFPPPAAARSLPASPGIRPSPPR